MKRQRQRNKGFITLTPDQQSSETKESVVPVTDQPGVNAGIKLFVSSLMLTINKLVFFPKKIFLRNLIVAAKAQNLPLKMNI